MAPSRTASFVLINPCSCSATLEDAFRNDGPARIEALLGAGTPA